MEIITERPSRLLIVDDEELIVSSLTRFFSRKGYDVRGTSNPEEALHIIEEETFDAVIVDLLMPPVSGFQIVKRLNDRLFAGKIIIMSSLRKEQSAEYGPLNSDAYDAYIEKPFNLKIFPEVLDQLGVNIVTSSSAYPGESGNEAFCANCGPYFLCDI